MLNLVNFEYLKNITFENIETFSNALMGVCNCVEFWGDVVFSLLLRYRKKIYRIFPNAANYYIVKSKLLFIKEKTHT